MFQNLKIGVRLAIGFGLLVCLLIAVTALSYVRINQIDDSIEEVSKRNMPKVAQAHAAIDQVNVTARALRNALLVRSADDAQKESSGYWSRAGKLPNCTPSWTRKLPRQKGASCLMR